MSPGRPRCWTLQPGRGGAGHVAIRFHLQPPRPSAQHHLGPAAAPEPSQAQRWEQEHWVWLRVRHQVGRGVTPTSGAGPVILQGLLWAQQAGWGCPLPLTCLEQHPAQDVPAPAASLARQPGTRPASPSPVWGLPFSPPNPDPCLCVGPSPRSRACALALPHPSTDSRPIQSLPPSVQGLALSPAPFHRECPPQSCPPNSGPAP